MLDKQLFLNIGVEREGFSMEVREQLTVNGITAIFGPSGAGKSSLLRAIAGFDDDVSGLIQWQQMKWQDETTTLPPHKRSCGFVFQESRLFPHLTVRGNLDFAWRQRRQPWPDNKYGQVVTGFSLDGLLEKRPDQLSGGERRRVAFARALLSAPDIMLVDEPLTGLDVDAKSALLPFIRKVHEDFGIPMLYVSHDVDEVLYLANQLVLIQQGRIQGVAEGSGIPPLLRQGQGEAANILFAHVENFDPSLSMATLGVSGHSLSMACETPLCSGTKVRLKIAPEDVAIALNPLVDISIRNQLKARISDLCLEQGGPYCRVSLDIGDTALVAQITKSSAQALRLTVGNEVWALIKGARIKGFA